MARLCFATVVLALLYCSRQTTATDDGYTGHLRFMDFSDADTYTVPRGDTTYGTLSLPTDFPFGDSSFETLYISINGYFSLGKVPPYDSLANFPLSSSSDTIIAPFAADYDTTFLGAVRYADLSDDYTQSSLVRKFIRQETNNEYFFESAMVAAEWVNVEKYDSSSTNTFQGILITDGESSYAVFLYECGGMEWGGGIIGWQASTSDYESHSLSGDSDNDEIGCLYSSSTSAVIYPISTCSSGDFTCTNGDCISHSYACDQFDDCGDNSDEEGCVNIPVVVGSVVAVVILLGIGGVIVCVVCSVMMVRRRRRCMVQTCVVTTTPIAAPTTVGAIDSDYQTAPLLMPANVTINQGQYQPQQGYPIRQAPQILSNPVAGSSPQPKPPQMGPTEPSPAYPPPYEAVP